MNPLNWGTEIYGALVVAMLLLCLVVPWSASALTRFVEEVCLILPAGLFYFLVRGLVHANVSVAEAHAERIVALERPLGLFVEPNLQAAIGDHSVLIDLFNWIYVWGHWPVILGWVVWMWSRHHHAYPLYRNAVLLSGAAGMIVFALYPLVPPRLMPELGVTDTVSLRSHFYRTFQPPSLTNLYASMPSLHFGWNLIVGVAITRHAKNLLGRTFGAMLPIAMFSAIVFTANHYILDGIVGGVIAFAGLAVSAHVTSVIPRQSNDGKA